MPTVREAAFAVFEHFGVDRLFGNPDDAFLQSRPKYGLLTTSEIRVIALCELDLRPTSIVWDIGAGSGSVAIEAAQIASQGKVYAIEMDVDDCQLTSSNAERFGVKNLQAIHGSSESVFYNQPSNMTIAGALYAFTAYRSNPFLPAALAAEMDRPGSGGISATGVPLLAVSSSRRGSGPVPCWA